MSDYKPPYRLRPYQSGGVEKLYEEIANAGYFAVLFYALDLKGEDRACGNWVGLYEKHKHDDVNGSQPFQRGPLLWRLVEKHRIGVCGTGNGGRTAHNKQFEVNALGFRELFNFTRPHQTTWRNPSGWANRTAQCVFCKKFVQDHANDKCLYGETWFMPGYFEGAWWFPQHMSDANADRSTLVSTYGGTLITI